MENKLEFERRIEDNQLKVYIPKYDVTLPVYKDMDRDMYFPIRSLFSHLCGQEDVDTPEYNNSKDTLLVQMGFADTTSKHGDHGAICYFGMKNLHDMWVTREVVNKYVKEFRYAICLYDDRRKVNILFDGLHGFVSPFGLNSSNCKLFDTKEDAKVYISSIINNTHDDDCDWGKILNNLYEYKKFGVYNTGKNYLDKITIDNVLEYLRVVYVPVYVEENIDSLKISHAEGVAFRKGFDTTIEGNRDITKHQYYHAGGIATTDYLNEVINGVNIPDKVIPIMLNRVKMSNLPFLKQVHFNCQKYEHPSHKYMFERLDLKRYSLDTKDATLLMTDFVKTIYQIMVSDCEWRIVTDDDFSRSLIDKIITEIEIAVIETLLYIYDKSTLSKLAETEWISVDSNEQEESSFYDTYTSKTRTVYTFDDFSENNTYQLATILNILRKAIYPTRMLRSSTDFNVDIKLGCEFCGYTLLNHLDLYSIDVSKHIRYRG